jgi:hypothetical protein
MSDVIFKGQTFQIGEDQAIKVISEWATRKFGFNAPPPVEMVNCKALSLEAKLEQLKANQASVKAEAMREFKAYSKTKKLKVDSRRSSGRTWNYMIDKLLPILIKEYAQTVEQNKQERGDL